MPFLLRLLRQLRKKLKLLFLKRLKLLRRIMGNTLAFFASCLVILLCLIPLLPMVCPVALSSRCPISPMLLLSCLICLLLPGAVGCFMRSPSVPAVQSSFWHPPEDRPWGFYCRVDVEVVGSDGVRSVVMRDVAIRWETLRSWGGVIPSGFTAVRVYRIGVYPVWDEVAS